MDETWYKTHLRIGSFTKEQIPTIDWDGETNLILNKPWIVKDVGISPSVDDVLMEVRSRRDPLPPSNRLFGLFGFFLINRRVNEMRKR